MAINYYKNKTIVRVMLNCQFE